MPTALVTGGAGFIGSHLCELLMEDGWEVFALDDLSTGGIGYGDHREERPLAEEDRRVYGPTTQKRWLYAESKAIDEFLALASHHERGLDCVIVRLFNTVGPRQSGQYGMVIPRFVRNALKGVP